MLIHVTIALFCFFGLYFVVMTALKQLEKIIDLFYEFLDELFVLNEDELEELNMMIELERNTPNQ